MYKEIDYKCEDTWKLFHDGKTKGVFQLESSLGRSWSKKLSPNNNFCTKLNLTIFDLLE